jgi:hypothetical protein
LTKNTHIINYTKRKPSITTLLVGVNFVQKSSISVIAGGGFPIYSSEFHQDFDRDET